MHPSGVPCSVPKCPGSFQSTFQACSPYPLQIRSAHTQLQCWVVGWFLDVVPGKSTFNGRSQGHNLGEIPTYVNQIIQANKCPLRGPLMCKWKARLLKVIQWDQAIKNLKIHCFRHEWHWAWFALCRSNLTVLSDFQTSQARLWTWGQMLWPDAAPVCTWMDINVLATRQARLIAGVEQPRNLYRCCYGQPDLDCLMWVCIKGKASVCVYSQ